MLYAKLTTNRKIYSHAKIYEQSRADGTKLTSVITSRLAVDWLNMRGSVAPPVGVMAALMGLMMDDTARVNRRPENEDDVDALIM